jgi:hypothetical protein
MSGALQGTVGYTTALTGTVGIAGTVNVVVPGTVIVEAVGSGDLVRPIYSVMQALTVQFSPAAAGGTVTLLSPAAGLYIEELAIACNLAATSVGAIALTISKSGTQLALLPVALGTTAGAVVYVPGLLKKYLASSSAGNLTIATTAVTGLSGQIYVNMTYATTGQIGP